MIPTFLISKLVKQHCSVALGGDGADELFCGYNHYQRYLIMEKMLKLLPDWIKREYRIMQNFLPVGMKGAHTCKISALTFRQVYQFM